MVKGIFYAARGLHTRMKNLEIIANNLANFNTIGFKRESQFSEILNQFGNINIQQSTDFKQGELEHTNNPMDVAISGKGFFVLNTKDGYQLTRGGNFQIANDGHLVNQDGYDVMGKNGPIIINNLSFEKSKDLSISKNGEIKMGDKVVDSLMIARLNNPQAADRVEGGNFSAAGSEIQPANPDNYQIIQGYLEESNVNPIKEMENMIQLNVGYDSAGKMMRYIDQTLNEANQIGKV